MMLNYIIDNCSKWVIDGTNLMIGIPHATILPGLWWYQDGSCMFKRIEQGMSNHLYFKDITECFQLKDSYSQYPQEPI
jgi:hypothetical protein